MSTREEDFISYVFVTSSHANILFITDRGKAYLKKVYQVPQASRVARGRAVVNLVGMQPGESLAAIVPIREFVDDGYLLTCTRRGRVKRTELSAYSNIRRTGIIAVGIDEGDELLGARVVRERDHVLIGTASGMSIRFEASQVRSMGRGSMGVRGIDLREGDRVVGLGVVEDDDAQVLTIGAHGYGKRTPLPEWTLQKRGGLGRIAMKVSDKTGEMVKLRLVNQEDQLMVITDGGQIIRTRVNEIRTAGRNTQGVIVIRLNDGERGVDVEPVAEHEEDAEEATEAGADDSAVARVAPVEGADADDADADDVGPDSADAEPEADSDDAEPEEGQQE